MRNKSITVPIKKYNWGHDQSADQTGIKMRRVRVFFPAQSAGQHLKTGIRDDKHQWKHQSPTENLAARMHHQQYACQARGHHDPAQA